MKVLRKMSWVALLLALIVTGGVVPSGAADGQALTGKVVDSMDAGGYTYVQIESGGIKSWVAVPKTKVVNGQEIAFAPGAVMNNFESKTLKRTFDSIVFSSGVTEKAK